MTAMFYRTYKRGTVKDLHSLSIYFCFFIFRLNIRRQQTGVTNSQPNNTNINKKKWKDQKFFHLKMRT